MAAKDAWSMYSWRRTDAEQGFSLNDIQRFPGFERMRRVEAFLFELCSRVVRGDNWQVFVELLLYHAVKMVLVHVREHN